MEIICFHLYNDFSGSPRVLCDVIEELLSKGAHVTLVSGRGGVLDSLQHPHLKRRTLKYTFARNKILRAGHYAWWQIKSFFLGLTYITRPKAIFYINTLLPVGAALAGRITGHDVVYHYHEHAPEKGIAYRFLAKAMQTLANTIICVSDTQLRHLNRHEDTIVIPNRISPVLRESLRPNPEEAFERGTVLMLSSLRSYKGIDDFIELARIMPEYQFILASSETRRFTSRFVSTDMPDPLPANLHIYPRTDRPEVFYNQASVVVNLSDPKQHTETFGMTAIEAMHCALPLIVPCTGGIADLVQEGVEGYHISGHDHRQLKSAITRLLTDKELYCRMAQAAQKKADELHKMADTGKITRTLSTLASK